MSVSAVASLRPLVRQRLGQCSMGLLSVQVQTRSASLELCALVSLRRGQLRYASNKVVKNEEDPKPAKHTMSPVPDMPFGQFMRRVIRGSFRNMRSALTPRGIRDAWRDSPYMISLLLLLWIITIAYATVALREFYQIFYTQEVSRYPEPVANTLRRAIYYTIIKPDPDLALKFYKKAMEQSTEIGLDPFSDEVLGIRIYVSNWLEKVNNHASAAEVLESVLADCRKWIDVMEQSVKDGKINEAGRLIGESGVSKSQAAITEPQDAVSKGAKEPTAQSSDDAPIPETLWRKRQRLLAKAVGTSVRLGQLYADEHVLDRDKSHEHLLWAVETSLKEIDRRRKEGPKAGEQAWLTAEELGGSMESLGQDYERRGQFHLAIPLFFQALRLCESPCHRAVIMNNLSAAFAQHPIYSPPATEAMEVANLKAVFDSSMPSTRKDCLDAAAAWARNAYTHGQDVKGEQRTAECDEACAVALCNWGDVAAMQGKPEVARDKYQKCIDLSKKLNFPPGIKQASEGLSKLSKAASP